MHSFIDTISPYLLIVENNSIFVLSANYTPLFKYTHTKEIYFLKDNVFIDTDKNVFTVHLENTTLNATFCCQLNKNISSLKRVNDTIYFCDRFGDIYFYKNQLYAGPGNLCFTTDFLVRDLIWIGDKYGRIRITKMCGTIEKFVFLENSMPILFMVTLRDDTIIAIRTKSIVMLSNEGEVIEEIEICGDVRKLVVKNEDSFYVLTSINVILFTVNKIIMQEEIKCVALDGIYDGETLHLLQENGKLTNLKNDKIFEMNCKYKDNFYMLKHTHNSDRSYRNSESKNILK